jgi:ubiquinone/menaquinone biosynthesis C-methylase UbiE
MGAPAHLEHGGDAMTEEEREPTFSTSTGIELSDTGWLDTHFEASRPEYEAQLRAVGIQSGWQVLDAASGAGSYVPWIAEMVGADGGVVALDLTPENAAMVADRVARWDLPCPVEARQGDITRLPFSDNSFDAVWFANTAQYLTEDELLTALREFRRVVRPGGLIAVKDSAFIFVSSLPPFLLERLWATIGVTEDATGHQWASWAQRTPVLRRWLERSGLAEVSQRWTTIERWAPYETAMRAHLLDAMTYFADLATKYGMPASDLEAWARASDPDSPMHPINDPEGYFREGNVLAVGRVE